jgi:hypothetical protein
LHNCVELPGNHDPLDGRIPLGNEGARRLYGDGPQEVAGKSTDMTFAHPKLSFDP